MLASNLCYEAHESNNMSAENSFFEEKEPKVWTETAVPKFEDLRMTRSMKALLSGGQENTDPNATAPAVNKNTPVAAGTKRRRSEKYQGKPPIFKVNPLYDPPMTDEETAEEEAVTSPRKKRNVTTVKSPHTKEKEMVSAILQLASYGMIHSVPA